MILFKKGNLFDSQCQTLVNTVNCKGVMGAGLAKQFKTRFPDMFQKYRIACKNNILQFGGDLWCYNYVDMFRFKKILCFATKENWYYPSKLEWIERGLQNFIKNYKFFEITSIAFPKLGCQNRKLNWENAVKPLMIKYLDNLNIDIEIYE